MTSQLQGTFQRVSLERGIDVSEKSYFPRILHRNPIFMTICRKDHIPGIGSNPGGLGLDLGICRLRDKQTAITKDPVQIKNFKCTLLIFKSNNGRR